MKLSKVVSQSRAIQGLRNWLEAQKEIKFEAVVPELIEFDPEFPVDELVSSYNIPLFQRDLQVQRLKKIAVKMRKFGYIFIPICVDENKNIIDGHHRTVVANELKIKNIPVVTYRFKSNMEKAKFFSEMQTPVGGALAVEERINSRKIAKYPYETLICKLITSDEQSEFYDKVVYKGISNKKAKIGIPCFINILNWIGLGITRKWQADVDQYLQTITNNMGEHGYIIVRNRLNSFARWLFAWAGSTKQPNSLIYKEKIMYAIMIFYLSIIHQFTGEQLKRVKKLSIKRFSTFEPQSLMSWDITATPEGLRDFYNKQRTTNRVEKMTFEGLRIPSLHDQLIPKVEAK